MWETRRLCELICFYVSLAAELKEKLQLEMEKNARMLEVDVVSKVTLHVRCSPFLCIAPAGPESPQESASPDSDRMQSEL